MITRILIVLSLIIYVSLGMIILDVCIAAVPYADNLANIYIRPLDGRDTIYENVGIPPKAWADKYGGLSERTLIIGNLQTIPGMLREIDALKKKNAELTKNVTYLMQRIGGKPAVSNPNKVKE